LTGEARTRLACHAFNVCVEGAYCIKLTLEHKSS